MTHASRTRDGKQLAQRRTAMSGMSRSYSIEGQDEIHKMAPTDLQIKNYEFSDRWTGVETYRTLNATRTQLKNCPFGVNTTIDLKNITTSYNISTLFRQNTPR
jgi:hypothetical protein